MVPIDYSKLHILVIEDETFTLELTCALLRSLGVERVTGCQDSEESFLELERARPDIIFCDIRMAGMDGRQFLRQVRAAEAETPHRTPIVFLTSDTGLAAREPQVDGYLVKPVDRDQIQDRIDKIVAADESLRERLAAM